MVALQPWLTVVTVTKDDTAGLQRTARSLGTQTVDGYEWIIIDGSTEVGEVPNLLRATPAPHRYRHQEPTGIYAAMNLGLELASSPYIYFLNGGDALHSPKSLHAIREGIRAKPLWLYGQVAFISDGGRPRVPTAFDYPRERDRMFAHGRFPSHQGTVVRTDALRSQGGFDTTYRVAADYAMVLKLSRASDPVELNDVIADFYVGGLSTTAWARSLAEFHRARREVLQPTGSDSAREIFDTLTWGAKLMAYHWIVAPVAGARRGGGS